MNETWAKIKLWTKIVLGVALAAYLILFVYNNSGDRVDFWYWFNHAPHVSAFFLAMVAFVAGVVCALMVSTTYRTMRQLRSAQSGRRLERLEREQAELRAKAARLQQQSVATPTVVETD